MIDPSGHVVGPGAEISDIDLDEEDLRLPDGRRLTEALAEQLGTAVADRARARRAANLVPEQGLDDPE